VTLFGLIGSHAQLLHSRKLCFHKRLFVAYPSVVKDIAMTRHFLCLLTAIFLASSIPAAAQNSTKVPRIGYISGTGSSSDQGPYVEALRHGLRDLGYVEGKNILIEYRGAEGKTDRIPTLVAELIALPVDLLIAPVLPAVVAAKKTNKATPVVMVTSVDPIASKLVDNLARPGGNVTGISTLAQDLNGKRLELLAEVVPRLRRVGILRDVESENSLIQFKEYETKARILKIELQSLDLQGTNPDLEGAFLAATKANDDAIITITNANLFMQQKRLVDLALKNRLPSMFQGSTWVDAGGLISYSTDEFGAFRRAAVYVDKILKGAKPADLPVEQLAKFEFVINLKTAKQIGLNIPQSVLYRADRVVK
jgi:putative tryptophan/tyrosine transport system substrate-binding protein